MLHSKNSNLSSTEIDIMWGQLADKQKKKYSEDHKKKQKAYVAEFENFVRVNCYKFYVFLHFKLRTTWGQNLGTAELKSFRAFMKNREKELAHGKNTKDDGSSDEENNPISSNEDHSDVSSNEEQQSSIESSDDD